MTVLVTGGAGFIGSHVAEMFLDKGEDVLVVDNLSSGHRKNVPEGAKFYELDIRQEQFTALVNDAHPEIICHLAAQMDVRKSVEDPVNDAEINVLGTLKLAKAAASSKTRLIIFASTGGAIYGEQDSFPADESHPKRPVSPYGTAKYCAEQYLGLFARTGGAKCVFLRFANVYGPRQDPHGEAGVVAIFSRMMLSGETPTIFGDGGQTRDYVYVQDVARAYVLAVEKDAEGAINIGTGIETDVNRLAELIAGHSGFKGEARHAPERPGEQRRSCIDPSLAARSLGWRPEHTIEEGLARTVEYFRQNLDG